MPAQDWILVGNQFEIVTQHSRRRMNTIALDHLARLHSIKGNVHVTALFNRTQPLVLTWSEYYTVWTNTKSILDGVSRQIEAKVEELVSVRVARWDMAVASAYAHQVSKYQQIFPLGREPLLLGTLDDRIAELHALATRVRKVGDLDSLAREIDAYRTELEGLRTVQQRIEQEVASAREVLEPKRKLLATMLYRNLGALIEIYADDPTQIGAFYDFQMLQEPVDPSEDDAPEPEKSPELKTHIAPMIGAVEPPIAVTGRRVPPGGNSVRD